VCVCYTVIKLLQLYIYSTGNDIAWLKVTLSFIKSIISTIIVTLTWLECQKEK